jgi:hypothetical protein
VTVGGGAAPPRHPARALIAAAAPVCAYDRIDQEETAPMTTSVPQGPHWFADRTRALAADNRAMAQ